MLTDLIQYRPSQQSVWQGREDGLLEERYFQQVVCQDIRTLHKTGYATKLALLGFCCDEGVRRNQGRVGAASAPMAIRNHLGNMASFRTDKIIDLGDLSCEDDDLERAQQSLGQVIDFCHQKGLQPLLFGGGHETAWGHYQGLIEHYPNLGILNFDAHFDLRDPIEGCKGSSGTPFYQIKKETIKRNQRFEYCCLGVQMHANTASMYERAQEWGVTFLEASQIHQENSAWQKAFLDDFILRQDALYISVCMDVFAQAFAPGVSAPQASGLTPWQVLSLLKYTLQTGKVVAIDIVELSPPFDEASKTARLAASIAAECLRLF